jgi:uncharacterized protein (TIGR02246 family)
MHSTPIEIVLAVMQAFDARDADALAECFVEDATLVSPFGEVFVGPEEIRQNYEETYVHRLAYSVMQLNDVSAHLLDSRVAVAIAKWTRFNTPDAPEYSMPTTDGIFSFTLISDGFEWRVASLTSLFVTPEPPSFEILRKASPQDA